MNAVPPGWTLTTIGALGRYLNGRAFKKEEWATSGRPIIRIQNLTGSSAAFNYFQGDVEDRYVVRPGDLLVSWAATLGAYFWSGPEAVLNQHIFKVESRIDVRFHKYLLDYKLDELMRHTHGSGMVHITRGRFDSVPVAIPPLEEQRRIVDILEDHLSRLEAADALLSVNLARTTTFGSLIYEAALRRAAKESGGSWRSMGEVCEFVTDGDHNPPKRVQTGIPHVTAKGVRDGIIDLAGCTFIDESGFERTSKRYLPQAGDVLITCVGTIGRVAVVPTGITFSADRNLAGLRPRARLVAPEYLALAANSVTLQHAMKRASGSTAQPHLYLRDIRALPVPTPELEVQQQLVRWVDDQSVSRGRLRSALDLARRRSSMLRRSLLQAAFSGHLTGRSSDLDVFEESASV